MVQHIALHNIYTIHIHFVEKNADRKENVKFQMDGTPEGTFLFQYLPEKKLKQKELEKKSKQ